MQTLLLSCSTDGNLSEAPIGSQTVSTRRCADSETEHGSLRCHRSASNSGSGRSNGCGRAKLASNLQSSCSKTCTRNSLGSTSAASAGNQLVEGSKDKSRLNYGNEARTVNGANHQCIILQKENSLFLSHPNKRATPASNLQPGQLCCSGSSTLTWQINDSCHPKEGRPSTLTRLTSLLLVFLVLLQLTSEYSCKSIDDKELNISINSISNTLIATTKSPTYFEEATTKSAIENSGSTVSDFFKKIKTIFVGQQQKKTTTQVPEFKRTTTTTVEDYLDSVSDSDSTECSNADCSDDSSEINKNDTSIEYHDDDAKDCESLSNCPPTEAKNLTDNERLVNLQSAIQERVKKSLLKATRSGMEMFEKLSLSGGCSSSLMNLMSSLGDIKSFAFKFLDASAKIPSGVMNGLLSDFGDFDQCLSIRSNPNVTLEDEAEEQAYSGKYCLMSVKLNYHLDLKPNETVPEGIFPDGVLWDKLVRNYWTSKSPKGFQVGMCFPSRCTNDDLAQIYKHVAESYNVIGEVMSCQDGIDLQSNYQPSYIQKIIIGSFYTLITITILGTLIHRYRPDLAINSHISPYNSPKSLSKCDFCDACGIRLTISILVCFSLIKNWRTFIRKDRLVTTGNNWSECSTTANPIEELREETSREDVSSSKSITEQSNFSLVLQGRQNSEESETSSNERLCRQLTIRIQPDNSFKSPVNSSLRHLSGLKLFVILWITIGHSFLYPSANNYQYYRSIINMNITRDSVWFAATNFTLGIDMLLYMSGLVFVYKLVRNKSTLPRVEPEISTDARSGIIRLISKKILRFWPTYLAVIALAIVVPLMSDGPMWPEMVSKKIGASCRKNWWANLLFINNFLNESEICLPSSWFLSVLMQLFFIGSFVILIGQKFGMKAATIVLSFILTISIILSFSYAYLMDIRAPVIKMDESFILELDENIFGLYTSIFNNLGPFLIGMAGGFLLVGKQRTQTSLSASVNKSSFSLDFLGMNMKKGIKRMSCEFITALLIATISALVLSSVFYQEYSRFWSAVYWALHRIGWAIVTGYIVHNCATGRWQLLNDLLSLSTFIPLSRLVFIAYLVYPIFIHIHSGLVRDGLHVSIYNMLNIYITRLVMTFATALFIHLLVELPFCSVEEFLLGKLVCKVNSSAKSKESNRIHPLLAVAPVVSIPIQGDSKTQAHNQEEAYEEIEKVMTTNSTL